MSQFVYSRFVVMFCAGLFSLALLFGVATPATADEPSSGADEAQASEDKRDKQWSQWERMFARRGESLELHQRAMGRLTSLVDEYPDDYEIQWKCARAFYYFSQRYEKEQDDLGRAIQVTRHGLRCAERAVRANPRDFEGKYWRLMHQVRVTAGESQLRALREAAKFVKTLEQLVEEHPDRAEARMMLGGLYRVLPGPPVSFGNNRRSLDILKEAEKIGPVRAELALELAETHKALGNTEKARAYYLKATKAPGYPGMDFELEDARRYGREMYEKLGR